MSDTLINLALETIKKELGLPSRDIKINNDWLKERATFVTLTIDKKLRGCIGSLYPRDSIYNDVINNSLLAAFKDPRFPPLQLNEINNLEIEISILGELKELHFKTEHDIINLLEPYKMGLVLEHGYKRGTFLPQVWEHYPSPEDFLYHLKLKSGLPSNFFSKDMKVYYYYVEKISNEV